MEDVAAYMERRKTVLLRLLSPPPICPLVHFVGGGRREGGGCWGEDKRMRNRTGKLYTLLKKQNV